MKLNLKVLIPFLLAVCSYAGMAQTVQTTQTAQPQPQTQSQPLDKRNLVTREWNTDAGTNLRFLDHETIYDASGRKVQETEYTKLGKLWTKKYEYGPDGKVSRELTYNDRGRLDSIQKFEYNEFGKKKAVYTYDAKGRLVKTKVIEYKFLDNEK